MIFLILYEMNSSVVPTDPEERGKLMTTLVELIKSDLDSGALIMSGVSPEGSRGFLVSKQDAKEIYGRSGMVGPYAKFEVLPMLTIDEVMDVMKSMQK